MQEESRTPGQLPQPPLGEFEPGSIAFDDYLIIGKVGAGGMGVVYKATNIMLDRNAALKVLPVDALSANEVLRFQNEARTLSKLEHANIARLFDFGIGEGQRPYLSMEFVEGDTLEDSIEKNGPLPLDLFFEVFIQICNGLDHAHAKGIVHRDVKSSNIMLSVDDSEALRAVLLDFGVAKMSDESGRMTKPGSMIGSPLYISPEQIVGEPATVASDIYSLSCVMFCALTGEPPFSGETILETLALHRDGVVPIEKVEEIDGMFPELCDLIEKGLSKLSTKRPQSVREIATQLAALACQLPDTEAGVGDDFSLFESPKLTGDDSDKLSDRAAQMLSETATRKLPVDTNEGKTKKNFIIGGMVLLSFAVIFVGAVLFNAFTTVHPRDEKPPLVKEEERVYPVFEDPNLKKQLADKAVTTFMEKTSPAVDKFLNGERIQNPVILTCLHEADNARKTASPRTNELYMAMENYNKALELRQENGKVEAPDLLMARAYVGLYDCEFQLRQYDKLADLEKLILKYCPKGTVADEAYACIQKVANANVKRKKTLEALRCLESAAVLLERNEFEDAEQIASQELNIGTTYIDIGNYTKAKLWLDKACAAYPSKLAQPTVTHVASQIRAGYACRLLKDYKGAIQRFKIAEKLVSGLDIESRGLYTGHLSYQWAVALVEMKKYDEAESRIQKGLAVGDERTIKSLKKILENVKEYQAAHPKVAQ